MIRLQVALDASEADALARVAAAELRDPRDQIRALVREYLARRGLLEPEAIAAPAQEVRHE